MGIFDWAGAFKKLYDESAAQEHRTALNTLRESYLELQDRTQQLAAENRELKEQLANAARAAALEFDGSIYWETTAGKRFAICPRCKDADGVIVHLQPPGSFHIRACPNCDKNFQPARGEGSG
jgi:hypothetical protein